jgi:hypothetical protein
MILVITPYKLQMVKLRQKLKERYGDAILQSVDVNTVILLHLHPYFSSELIQFTYIG